MQFFSYPGTSHLLPLTHPFCFMNHENSEGHSEGLVAVKQMLCGISRGEGHQYHAWKINLIKGTQSRKVAQMFWDLNS